MQQNPANAAPPFPLSQGGPNLLIQWPAGSRVFFSNLRDVLFPRAGAQPPLSASPAPFWPDVFVNRPVAWRCMFTSALYHIFLIVAVWGLSVTWLQRAPVKTRSPFDNSKITYYSVSEYLPEIDTGSSPAAPAKEERKGEPKYAKQRIISIPRAPDNFRQTIVTPSQIKLPHDVNLPNLVAWTPIPSPVPQAALMQSPSELKLPQVPVNVVAPPPDPNLARMRPLNAPAADVVAPAPAADALRSKSALPNLGAPEVVAPAPSVASAKSNTRLPNLPDPSVVGPPVSAAAPLGTMNVARLDPTVAAPKLPVAPQHAASAGSAGGARGGHGGAAAASVPPAPNVAGVGNGKQAAGQLIALGLDPAAVNGPIAITNGSRSGQFAATPEGNPNAPGTPDIKGGGTRENSGRGSNGGGSGRGSAPAGISVGRAPSQAGSGVVAQGDPANAASTNSATEPRMMASLERSRASDLAREGRFSRSTLDAPGKIEDKVFAGKRYYSMTLNMPNLTSAGGSWIIRFAELDDHSSKGDLSAPQPTLKVDPAYPAELMRDRVEGTVTLFAVIHKDGTVGDVRVLRGVEHQLDENARQALSRWRFRPATRNGAAVELEAVVQIPFSARKLPF
jgi:TonB family protein